MGNLLSRDFKNDSLKCQSSKSRRNTKQCSVSSGPSVVCRKVSEPEEAPQFSEKEKAIVRNTWKTVQNDIAKVGVVMFMKLFETHPDVQDIFMPFKGLSQDELKHNQQLAAHALRVMATVEKCISRLDEPENLIQLLHEIGARHVTYNAKVDYIDLVGPQFLYAIQPVLGEQWTFEVEEAWSNLFKVVSFVIKQAMTF